MSELSKQDKLYLKRLKDVGNIDIDSERENSGICVFDAEKVNKGKRSNLSDNGNNNNSDNKWR